MVKKLTTPKSSTSTTVTRASSSGVDEKLEELRRYVEGSLSSFVNDWSRSCACSKPDGVDIHQAVENMHKTLMDAIHDVQEQLNAVKVSTEDQLDELETYSRRNCLLLHGLAEEAGEDTDCIALTAINEMVLKDSEVKLSMLDIDRSHRLGRPHKSVAEAVKKGTRPLIVKFTSYRARHLVFSNKKALKKTGVLLSESLTKRRALWYKVVRDVLGPRSTWTQDGKIHYIRDKKKFTIVCSKDFSKFASAAETLVKDVWTPNES